ncbi:MAG: hypothetical protein HY326_04795 [Chloroflexi bacterium]|nr:hypothetical protein [Chloroflexota bacterium]
MSGKCNGYVEWVAWKRETDAEPPGDITKWPSGAPDPKKPRRDILKGLNEKADEDAAKQSEPRKSCPGECRESEPTTEEKVYPGYAQYWWEEEYEGLDPNGATIKLRAKYGALGKAKFKKTRYRVECLIPVFGNAFYKLEDLEVKVPATLLAALSPEDFLLTLQKEGLLEQAVEIFDLEQA